LSFKQFENGTVLIGGGVRGTAFPDENRTRLDMAGLASFLETARDIFPIMRGANIVRAWAGIEGYTPDNLPVISRGSADGVVHAFGFSAHGFQLAPAVGGIVAHLAMGEIPNLPIEPFSVDRFAV
jgi:sarcosine oxidase, subunit beta